MSCVLMIFALATAVGGQTTESEWQAHMQRAQAAFVAGHLAEAAREFQLVLRLNPGNGEANANLGSIYFLQRNWKAAEEALQAALEKRPDLWKAQALLGLCKRRLGNEAEARELLERAIPHLDAGKFKISTEIELIESLYRSGDLDRALAVLANAQSEAPQNPDVLYIAYRIHTDLANQARDTLRLVAPESGRMHELTAQHLVNRGDLTNAIREYEAATKADPQLRGIHYELGEAYMQESVSPESLRHAEEEFRAALVENPSDTNPEAQLGNIALLRNDPDTAVEHFQKVLHRDAGNLLAQQGMGKALLHQNRPAEALPYVERSVQLDGLNPATHYELGMLYRKLGRPTDAERELKAFRELQLPSPLQVGSRNQ
jgi:tetratricopeptide (TPR) repeat protein